MSWKDRIVFDPDTCGGRPRVSGTQLTVEFLLRLFACGWTHKDVLENYPSLAVEDIRAVFAFVHEVIEEESYLSIEHIGQAETL